MAAFACFVKLSLDFVRNRLLVLFLLLSLDGSLRIPMLASILCQFFLCQLFEIVAIHSFELDFLAGHNLHLVLAHHFGCYLNLFLLAAFPFFSLAVTCLIML